MLFVLLSRFANSNCIFEDDTIPIAAFLHQLKEYYPMVILFTCYTHYSQPQPHIRCLWKKHRKIAVYVFVPWMNSWWCMCDHILGICMTLISSIQETYPEQSFFAITLYWICFFVTASLTFPQFICNVIREKAQISSWVQWTGFLYTTSI